MSNITKADYEDLLKQYQGENLDIVLNKIENGYPVQYAIGHVNFCGNKIYVNENVLIPRFETEFLVELVRNKVDKNFNGKIYEIGSGSGCISISLAKLFSQSTIYSIDINKEATNVSNNNKEANEVTNVTFENKDINDVDNFDGYDIIVSNPPYVAFDESVGEETKYEPQNAIFADDNGMMFYKKILSIVKNTINKPSMIFFEIGMNQGDNIKEIICDLNLNYNIEVLKDLANKDRYIYMYLNK